MNVAFLAIFAGPHGDTVEVTDPRKEAYVQAAYLKNVLRTGYSMSCHDDGAFTVAGDGLAPITFVRAA